MKGNIGFWLSFIVALGLFVGGFFVPPVGVIDGSVISAAGILLGFGVLAQIPTVIREFESARLTKGDMTIEVNSKKEQK